MRVCELDNVLGSTNATFQIPFQPAMPPPKDRPETTAARCVVYMSVFWSCPSLPPSLPPSRSVPLFATEDIMQLPDISISESEQIPVILEPLTAGICDAVLPQPAAAGRERQTTAAGAVGGVGLEELSAALAERTPAVMKLKARSELGWRGGCVVGVCGCKP